MQHLIAKVGGGCYQIDEFIANYEPVEIAKM
jgi:hypothetical protein